MATDGGQSLDYFLAVNFINGCLPLVEPAYTKVCKSSDPLPSTTSSDVPSQLSPPSADGHTVIWDQVLFSKITIPNIPLGTRLQIAMYSRKRKVRPAPCFQRRLRSARLLLQEGVVSDPKAIEPTTDKCVGWVNVALFNSAGFMKQGLRASILWTGTDGKEPKPDPVVRDAPSAAAAVAAAAAHFSQINQAPCLENLFDVNPLTVFIDFEPSVYFKSPHLRPRLASCPMPKLERGTAELQAQLEQLVKRDSLAHLSEEERKRLWDNRLLLIKDPRALPRVALAAPWDDNKAVHELYELLRFWAPLEASQAIELVGSQFSDPVLRAHGVAALDALSDAQVLQFLPQLVQGLKFELNHESALATMLIQRAFRNRHRIGHAFFWLLKAEMHLPIIAERYGLMLESYLRGAGTHRKELLTQVKVMDLLIDVALKIKKIPMATRLQAMQDMLRQVKLPRIFQLPLDPRLEVRGLRIEKCKFMNSKKVIAPCRVACCAAG